MACCVGDIDNDLLPDLVIVGYGDLRLYRNLGGVFRDITAASNIASSVDANAWLAGCALVDVDHDADLDLFVCGFVDFDSPVKTSAPRFPKDFAGRSDLLLRNNRDGTFTEISATAKINSEGGKSRSVWCGDFDRDGAVDLAVLGADGRRLWRNRRDLTFEPIDDDVLDGVDAPSVPSTPERGHSVAIGDFDGDGAPDRIVNVFGERAHLLRHRGVSGNWLTVRLRGQVRPGYTTSNSRGVGSLVEARAVGLWRREELRAGNGLGGCDAPEIWLNLGMTEKLDFVSARFPSGLQKAHVDVDANRVVVIEEPILSSNSCPVVFTWNGERFETITDTISAGILGELVAPGEYWQPDPDEWIRVHGDQLAARSVGDDASRFELRFVNPLEEVTYLDAVRLVVVDHPDGVEIYPGETMVNDPANRRPADFWAVRDARVIVGANDDRGDDATARLAAVDRRYVSASRLLPFKGFAAEWTVEFDLPSIDAGGPGALLLDGWTHWSSSASALAASQAGVALFGPILEARDPAAERWRIVDDDMGVSAGLPRTTLVDLRGRLRPGETRLRIRTNKMLYYDRIRVADVVAVWRPSDDSPCDSVRMRDVPLVSAELRWLGYPARRLPDGELPEVFDYDAIEPSASWGIHRGQLTSYGGVQPLLDAVDDRFVVMGHGEEVALRFDASGVASSDGDRSRTFLFFSHGYEKGLELWAAHSTTVGPLPFAAMGEYPYADSQAFTRDPERRRYLEAWNRRPSRGGPSLRIAASSSR